MAINTSDQYIQLGDRSEGAIFLSPQNASANILNASTRSPDELSMANALTRGIDEYHSNPAQEAEDIDQSENAGGGGSATDGFQIYWADGTTTFLDFDTVVASYSGTGDWSIQFDVTNNILDQTSSFVAGGALYDAVGNSQTVYRLPVYKNDQLVSAGGAFFETVFGALADIYNASTSGPITGLLGL